MTISKLDKLQARFVRVAKRDGGKCVYCGLDGSHDFRVLWNFDMDHLIPPSAGGSDEEINLVFACHSCNVYKGGYDPSQDGQIPLESRERLIQEARMFVDGRPNRKEYYAALAKEILDTDSK